MLNFKYYRKVWGYIFRNEFFPITNIKEICERNSYLIEIQIFIFDIKNTEDENM